jgi:hypothetical protein
MALDQGEIAAFVPDRAKKEGKWINCTGQVNAGVALNGAQATPLGG